MNVLGIETSCDETAAAVVADGHCILANVVASQVKMHAAFGGVVPEVASRQHLLWCIPVLKRALAEAQVHLSDLSAVAVTQGPGLAGSLLVGVNLAKALAFAYHLPLIGVNHLEGHLYANWLTESEPSFPLLCLIVSGGHSDLILMTDHGKYQRLGRTLDDAAGEAFDKVARILGLGYPGGPAIQAAAKSGDATAYRFPRAWLGQSYNFSFSGLKTAVLRLMEARAVEQQGSGGGISPQTGRVGGKRSLAELSIADLAASFQEAIVDVLVEKTRRAAVEHRVRQVALGGGVASNVRLRQRMRERIEVAVIYPPPLLCTDNAAMIASCGYFRWRMGRVDGLDLDVIPNLRFT
ncbi:MAG: tRNA (adenosine(37)-N6)-threonylcarbamoyltransferase complex transferase subunit TsaD [Chloroflexi bacterium]|nr:tRNA (adenosine(37)-N6)-threonylcarbamoyltransferase complex transferase subunit TsaD [Chloroflexota bacterium]MCL5074759.1 tRNA (adenosine(37)-N6)-threonylcarbamoyltransferase complex transferase subunit TsaD [Chloroflexota bacterium]